MSTETAAPAATASCTRCGRKLTSAKSIAAGYGKGCAAKIAAATKTADLADFKTAQVEAARELIEDAAIIQIKRNVFRSVSSDGREQYLTAHQNCNCPAGLRERRCYHTAAVRILTAILTAA
jgi:hypothetical protein